MAGGATPTPTSTGKKPVDFALNLIPMIDLLSVLISFLLMTSVWTSIAKIDVQQSPADAADLPATPEETLELVVGIKASGYEVRARGAIVAEIAGWDPAKLRDALVAVQRTQPDNRAVEVSSEDRVPYQELIRVMDVCLGERLSAISVSGVDP